MSKALAVGLGVSSVTLWLSACANAAPPQGNIRVLQENGKTSVMLLVAENINQVANDLTDEEHLYDGSTLSNRNNCAEALKKLNPRKTADGKEVTREDVLAAYSWLEVPPSCGGGPERQP